jgi:all-trans-nonaprenyl-diphosphate synthase
VQIKELNLQKILAPIEKDLETLEKRILENISPSSRSLNKILSEVFKSGGKRIRPAISFLVYRALCFSEGFSPDRDLEEKIFLIAEISELIHTASLVHDDIIDNSNLRRGKETTNNKWGNAISVISGDFMFAKAAVNLSLLDCNPIVKIFAEVLQNLCDGEIHQFEKQFSVEFDFDYYIQKSYKKTASLFEASARAPLELMDLDTSTLHSISVYGKNLGLAFQFVDDVLDFSSDSLTLGKPSFSDLKEGQITLPVLIALEFFYENDLAKFKSLSQLLKNLGVGTKSTQELSSEILDLLNSAEVFPKSMKFIQDYTEKAKSSLDFLESSIYKNSLINLLDFITVRKF